LLSFVGIEIALVFCTMMKPLSLEQALLGSLARYGNGILILGITAVLAMMIIPFSPPFLDFMLTINIIGGMTLLIVALSLGHPMQLSSFPTLLLISTLFRLGLNIASTRLILSKGYAGHIILTFGQFAAAGNLLVGMILFLIMTLVQFIVIAKGSERVAEVAARFTLDALPGKQMSIDADLRAGILSQQEAKALREELHRESKLYGSMDGAMKFVKGDAIAGLVIIFINLLGGLFTGIVQHGLSVGEAINTYSILTIGDGLVSQIPSLLISLTAGLVVTRVSGDGGQNSIGKEIGQQLASKPAALLTASGLCVLLGLIPGFPTFFFWLIAAVMGGSTLKMIHNVRKKMAEPVTVESYVVAEEITPPMGLVIPLTLEVGPELFRIFQTDPRWSACLNKLYPKLKSVLSQQLGVALPDLKLSINKQLTGSFDYQIRIHEIPVDRGTLMPRHCALLGDSSSLQSKGVENPSLTTETVHGTRVSLWESSKKESLTRKGLTIFGPEEMLLRQLARTLKKQAADFMGIQEIRNLLNSVESQFPELVREVVPKMMSIQKLTEIVKRLVEEEIPIKDFRLILQILSGLQPETKDPVTLTEQVRIGLKRTITFMHVREGNQLPVITLDPVLEEEIGRAIQKNGNECYLALPPERMQAINEAFKKCLWQNNVEARQCVALTPVEIRRYVRKMIEAEIDGLAVLSYQEIDPKVVLQPIGVVSALLAVA